MVRNLSSTDRYLQFCETLWRDWLKGSTPADPFVAEHFDLEAAPEPYLIHKAGQNPLFALLTNPGKTLRVQRRSSIDNKLLGGCIPTDRGYRQASQAFASWYAAHLKKRQARARLKALLALARLTGHDGLWSVESCPFHSPRLPKKAALLNVFQEDDLLQQYAKTLAAFLHSRPVVIVSAVSTKTSLRRGQRLSPWLTWQASLAGLRLECAEFVPLLKKGRKTTAAALVDHVRRVPKALVLMMGSNRLPSERGLTTLAEAMQG